MMEILVQNIPLIQFSFLKIRNVIIVTRIIAISNLPAIYNNSHPSYPMRARTLYDMIEEDINAYINTLK